jgi:hypothetical protein
MLTWNDLWQWAKDIVRIGGPSVAVAWGAFEFLGKKWLDNKFAVRLEELRHAKTTELEHIRHDIQATYSRITKIHEREFEVLPKAWFLLHHAYGSAFNVVGGIQPVPNFGGMTDAELEEFLSTQTTFSPSQKQRLRETTDKKTYYFEALFCVTFDQAVHKRRLFNNYIIKNRIFMTDSIYEKFAAVSHALSQGLNQFNSGKHATDASLEIKAYETITALDAEVMEISRLVQRRLHYKEDMI